MVDVVEMAKERSARLAAEIGEVGEFIHMARSWWKMMELSQKKSLPQ